MATTGAIVYVRPRAEVTVAKSVATGAAIYVPFRSLTGVFTNASGVSDQNNEASVKSSLPSPRVPIGYVEIDGRQLPVYVNNQGWYPHFRFVIEEKLGGISAPNLTDISDTVTSVQQATTSATTITTALTNQVAQNAEALATTREVAQNNSLTGASQIPIVQRTIAY